MFAPNQRGFLLLRVLLLNCALAAPLLAQQVPVVEKTLSNGMRLLLVERHDDPAVAGGWVAHVGSSNERPGITGIAHLFEHMMFKGTPVIGTTNYARDKEIMAAQEDGYTELKFFPALQAGGLAMLKAWQGPFGDVRFCPTGGISPANAADFLALPNVACVGGSWLTPADAVAQGDWARITTLARDAAALARAPAMHE